MANVVKKNQVADIPTKNGSKYSYQYVDIAQIHEYLEENNMSYYQFIDRIDGDDYIMTVKIVDGKELPPIRGSRIVDATLYGNDNPAQKQGSAITYARRYSLLMAFGLATEDDDANSLNKFREATEEDAKNYKFNGGKHAGETLEQVLKTDKQYVDWWLNNKGDGFFKQCYELITGEKLPNEEEQDSRIKLLNEINSLELETDTDHEEMLNHFKVGGISEMTVSQLEECKMILEKKLSKK